MTIPRSKSDLYNFLEDRAREHMDQCDALLAQAKKLESEQGLSHREMWDRAAKVDELRKLADQHYMFAVGFRVERDRLSETTLPMSSRAWKEGYELAKRQHQATVATLERKWKDAVQRAEQAEAAAEADYTLTPAGRRVLELERETERLEGHITDLERDNEQLTLALAEARIERGALWSLVGDSEALEAEVARLEDENERLNAQIDSQAEAYEEGYADAESNLRWSDEPPTMFSAPPKLAARVLELEDENDALREHITILEGGIINTYDMIDRLRNRETKLETEVELLRVQDETSRAVAESFRVERDAALEKVAWLTEQADHAPDGVGPSEQSYIDEILGLRAEVNWLTASLTGLSLAREQDLDTWQGYIEKHDSQDMELYRLRAELNEARAEVRVLETEAAALRALAAEADAPRQADNDGEICAADEIVDEDDDDDVTPARRAPRKITGMGLYSPWAKAKRTSFLEVAPASKYFYHLDGQPMYRNPAHSLHIRTFFWQGEWRPLTYEYAPAGALRTYARSTRRAGLNVERATKDAPNNNP